MVLSVVTNDEDLISLPLPGACIEFGEYPDPVLLRTDSSKSRLSENEEDG